MDSVSSIAIGSIAFVGAGFCAKTFCRLLWLSRYGRTAKGSVVYEEEYSSKGNTNYKPTVLFTDEYGVSHQFRSRQCNRFSQLGQYVKVKYELANPNKRPEIAEEIGSLLRQFTIYTILCSALCIWMFFLAKIL